MARFRYKHIQSTVENRKPSSLLDGEIAVNRFAGKEKLFLKNASGDVVSFSSDSQIDGKLAEKLSVSDFNTYSGAVDTAINSKASESDLSALSGTVTGHTADTDIHVTTADKTAWNAAATDSHTHSNKSALDAITSNVGTMAYENTSSYSSATQVNTALNGKSNTGHTHDDRYYTESELTGSSTTVVVAKAASATTAASADSVAWGNVSGKPETFTPSAHNQASNTITAMTSYSIASASGAVATNDTLNTAVGKLEKRIALLEAALGGMKLVKLTQAQYDALPIKDSNTLYVISD